MDPRAAGHPWNSGPVHTQPQWQSTPEPSHQNQLYNPRALVPPGLELLVEVEEVILQKQAFFTRSGQTLFTIHQESECCGPGFNVRFRNPYQMEVVSLYVERWGSCWSGYAHLKITVLPAYTIGFINIVSTSRKISVFIQKNYGEPAFTAELPLSHSENIIEILSVNGSCPVATITTEVKKKSSDVVFWFPMDMEATLKTLILAAFLYMKYELTRQSSSISSTSHRRGDTADGLPFHHGGFSGGLSSDTSGGHSADTSGGNCGDTSGGNCGDTSGGPCGDTSGGYCGDTSGGIS